jgi:hypothetical protein
MAPPLFYTSLLAVSAFALWRGGTDERVVAIVCLLGAAATHLLISPMADRFQSVESGVMIVDVFVLVGFLAVALRSYRFWPLWVAGLQLTTALGHLMKEFNSKLLPQAYGAALQFWGYPILLILAIGTWRAYRRQLREQDGLAP